MANYRLSLSAKEDLIRIHQFWVKKFGSKQADKYFYTFFEYFEIIAASPFAFEAMDFIRPGYRRGVCGSESIFYKVEEDMVSIMAIVGQQDINQIL